MTTINGKVEIGPGRAPSQASAGQSFVRVRVADMVTTAAGVLMLPVAGEPSPLAADGSFSLVVDPLPTGYGHVFEFVINNGEYKSAPLVKRVPASGTHDLKDLEDMVPVASPQFGIPGWYAEVMQAASDVVPLQDATIAQQLSTSGKQARAAAQTIATDVVAPVASKVTNLETLTGSGRLSEAGLSTTIDGSVAQGKQPWRGKKIYLYGDSISSTDYSAYATTLAEKTGATVVRGGHSGASVSALTQVARLDAVVNANPDLIIMMTSGNDQGAAGTVGTFVSPALNGEPVKTDPDITAPYTGSTFIEAAAYIARYLLSRRYLHGTKFLYLGGLPQRRNSHNVSDPWNNPLNHQRKSEAVREVCERYHIPFVDTLRACGWDMASEPFWVSPTSLTANNGVYTMDGLHPNPAGYDRLTDVVADVANNQLTSEALVVAVPPQPTGLATSNVKHNQVALSWAATGRTLDYIVEYRAVGGSSWTALAATYALTTIVTGLTPETAYEFRVTARNPTGSGTPSATVGATTAAAPVIPVQVTGLTAGTPAARTVPLTWTAIGNATAYVVEYRTGSGSWSVFGEVPTASATVSGLTPSTAYQFRVSAKNEAGTGPVSTTATATTAALVPVTDDFNRADSTTSMGTTPGGGKAWTPLTSGSVFGIVSNQAYRVTAAGNNENAVVVDSDMSDIDYQFTCAVRGSGGFGPVFRATDENNYWLIDASSGGWRLYKRVAGAFTLMGSVNAVASASGDVLRVVANGNSISASVNGGAALTVTDAFNQSATRHGFRASGAGASSPRADNVSIVTP